MTYLGHDTIAAGELPCPLTALIFTLFIQFLSIACFQFWFELVFIVLAYTFLPYESSSSSPTVPYFFIKTHIVGIS